MEHPQNTEPVTPETRSGTLTVHGLRELLDAGSEVEVPMRGGSMSPWLRAGDRLRLRPAREVRLGDVLLVVHESRGLVHRMIGRQGDAVLTRGDSVKRADPPSRDGQIVARVHTAWRGSRRLRWGFGPERVPLAILSRHGWLYPILKRLRQWKAWWKAR